MVDIGRLNVVLSADASQVQQASQAATSGLKQVEQQAQATGAQIDRLAAQMAKGMGGGSAADYRDLARKTFPTYAAAAAELGDAATAAEKVAAGAGKAATATTQAGTAAGLLAQHFDISAGTLVRSAGALVGVGLGLSAAVGLAQQLHNAIAGVVDRQLAWEQSARRTSALYGSAAAGVVATAQAQSLSPGTLGTTQEFLDARLNAWQLQNRYGVSDAGVTSLITGAGGVSKAFGYDAQQRADLQARALQFATGGGNSLLKEGIGGTPLDIARGLGFRGAEALAVLTPQQLVQAQSLVASQGLHEKAATSTDKGGLLNLRTDLEKQLEQAQNAQQNLFEPGNPYAAQVAYGSMGGTGLAPIGPGGTNTDLVDAAKKALEENAKALADHTQAAKDDAAALAKFGIEVGGAAAKLALWAGSIEDPYSIAHGDVAAGLQASVAARAVGPNPLYAKSATELAAMASNTGYAAAWQSYSAPDAQKAANGILKNLQDQANQQGPGLEGQRARANAAIAEAQRRATGGLLGLQAGQASDLAGRAQTEASATLQTIQIAQDTRRLDVAEKLAGLRKQALGYESQMAPLLLAQANLADRIEVTSRDNLATRKELIAAQQAALPANNAVEDLDYQQKRLELQAQARQSRLILGQDVSGLPSFDSLISQHVAGQLARPETELAALDANRPVQLAQRTQTAEGLTRASALADLEGQGRALRDQQIPLQEAQRLTQAKEDSIQRTLALMDLEDTKAIAAASRDLNAATLVRIEADATARAAEDYANGLDMGATAAERGRTALEKARDALKDIATMQDQANQANARIANGLGAGGIGPTAGTAGGAPPTLNLTFQISASNTDDVVKQVEAALRRELGAASAGPAPVPSSLAGARR